MYASFVLPELLSNAHQHVVVRKLRCFGAGESTIVSLLGDCMRRGRNPQVNCTVDAGVITLHIIATAEHNLDAQHMADADEQVLRQTLGDLVFGTFGLNHFKRDRCAMCIDMSAELADISIADYWGPRKPGEESYLSSILIRTSRGADWCWGAQKAGYVDVKESPAEYLINSSSFETKKHGSVFCLAQRQRYGWPTPNFHYRLSYAPFRRKI